MGDVGVDIFFREVQDAWDELYPFVDHRARVDLEDSYTSITDPDG